MKSFLAFIKKEYFEVVRTGRLLLLLLLFVLFGIMNPAIAKLTPWMMEMFADTMADSGLVIADIRVDAMTAWAQFFKNIPIALIAFVLMFSNVFTKEYKSGTLLLVLTKGLSRYKVVLAKTILLLSLWTFSYWICFSITYDYNAYFWDNGIVNNLFPSVSAWWLFGIWVICLVVLFSSLSENNTGVTLCTGGTVLAVYLLSLIPKVKTYSPAMLMDAGSLLTGTGETSTFTSAVIIAALSGILCIAVSIPVINKRQL